MPSGPTKLQTNFDIAHHQLNTFLKLRKTEQRLNRYHENFFMPQWRLNRNFQGKIHNIEWRALSRDLDYIRKVRASLDRLRLLHGPMEIGKLPPNPNGDPLIISHKNGIPQMLAEQEALRRNAAMYKLRYFVEKWEQDNADSSYENTKDEGRIQSNCVSLPQLPIIGEYCNKTVAPTSTTMEINANLSNLKPRSNPHFESTNFLERASFMDRYLEARKSRYIRSTQDKQVNDRERALSIGEIFH